MSYIDKSLGPGERILGRAYLAWTFTALAVLALLACLAVAGAAHYLLGNPAVTALAAAAGVAAFAALMLPVWTTEVAVTNQRLVVKRGWLSRSSEEIELWSIEQVDWRQDAIDRLFGFARLVVCGTGDDDMHLPLISHALEFRRAVQQAVSEARPGQRPA